MTQIAEAFVRVRAVADTASFQRSTREVVSGNQAVTRSLRDTEREFERFGRGALSGSGLLRGFGRAAAFASGTFIGGAGLVFALKSTIEAATNATATLALTQQAVKTTGATWDEYGDKIERVTLAQVHATGFTNDQLLRTFDTLVRRTGDVNRALQLNSLAANIARGRNISLEAATNLVIRATLGLSGALRRLGIDAPKGASGLQLIQLLTEKYAGSATAFAKTAAGAQAIFRAELQATEETIGTALLPTVTNLLTQGSNWLSQQKNQERIQRDVNNALKTAKGIVGDLSSAIGTLKQVTTPAVDAVGGLKNAIELLISVMVARKVLAFVGAIGQVGTTSTVAAAEVTASAAVIESRMAVLAGSIGTVGTAANIATGTAAGAGVKGLGLALRGLPATVGTTILIEALINKKPIDDWLRSHHLGFASKGIIPDLLGLVGGGGSATAATPPAGLNSALRAKVTADLSAGGGDFGTFGNPLALAGFPVNAPAPPGGTDAANQGGVPSRSALATRDQATATALALATTRKQITTAVKARLAFVNDTISFAKKLISEGRGDTKQLEATLQALGGERKSDQGILDQFASDDAAAAKKAADAAKIRAAKAIEAAKRAAVAAHKAVTDTLKIQEGALRRGIPSGSVPLFGAEGPQLYARAFAHNRAFATKGPYQTKLTPDQEKRFRKWVSANNVPFDPNEKTPDYDMRGYWLAMIAGQVPPWAGGATHFPDTFKTPYDTTFSAESKYATPTNPFRWNGNNLVDARSGQVVFGATARSTREDALISFYKREAKDSRLTRVERSRYATLATNEQEKEATQRAAELKAYIASSAKAAKKLADAAKTRAEATLVGLQNVFGEAELIKDPAKRLAAEKTADQVLVKYYEGVVKRLQKQKAGILAIRQAESDVISAKLALQSLSTSKASSGFTLGQLFAEAGSEFTSYSSNIGAPGSPLSPLDAGNALKGNIRSHQTTVVQNFYGARPTGQALADARAISRNSKG